MINLFAAVLYFGIFINGGLAQTATVMSCYSDHYWQNSFDGHHEVLKTDYLVNGQNSEHDDHHEDRRFQWDYCKPSYSVIGPFVVGGQNSVTLRTTEFDETWTRSCKDVNGGHAAFHGIVSEHDDHREDRKFTFHCGELDLSKHKLLNCKWTGIVNGYDQDLDYNCPDNGVIRGIWSQHDNHHEDRQFNFECCQMFDVTYEFGGIVGKWEEKISCFNCASTEYTRKFGTESSSSETIESSFSNSLSTSVSAGFEFSIGASASVEVTGEESQTISNQMTASFSTSYEESTTLKCENTYLYQWLMCGDEFRSDGSTGHFCSYASDYLCTNSRDPQCPPGYCSNGDCQICLPPFNETKIEKCEAGACEKDKDGTSD